MNRFITGVDEYIGSGLLPIYYGIVLLFGIILLLKFSKLRYSAFFIFIFWQGFFIYIGEVYFSFVRDAYNIFLVLLAIFFFGKSIFNNYSKKMKNIYLSFFFISFSYAVTWIINKDTVITNLSTYGREYLLPFLLLVALMNNKYIFDNLDRYLVFFKQIIKIQIVLSIIKIVILGFGESIVGSVTFTGGGLATTIPVISILLIWNYKPHAKQDWLFIFSLLLIALASNKRAPVFMVPLIIISLLVYVNKTHTLTSFAKYIPIFFILLYIGIKTNPSLNPERSRWGSFDLQYVAKYSKSYIYGDPTRKKKGLYYGRGGGTQLIFSEYYKMFPINSIIFGNGLTETLKTYDDFHAEKFFMASKATINGALEKIISFGYFGLMVFIIYGYSIINLVPLKRLKVFITVIFIFDIFFYDAKILGHNASATLFIFYIVFIKQSINYKKNRSVQAILKIENNA